MTMADNDELRERIRELREERDEWKRKADMYRRQLGGLTAAHNRLKQRMREGA